MPKKMNHFEAMRKKNSDFMKAKLLEAITDLCTSGHVTFESLEYTGEAKCVRAGPDLLEAYCTGDHSVTVRINYNRVAPKKVKR